jgi:hypothetical protein
MKYAAFFHMGEFCEKSSFQGRTLVESLGNHFINSPGPQTEGHPEWGPEQDKEGPPIQIDVACTTNERPLVFARDALMLLLWLL